MIHQYDSVAEMIAHAQKLGADFGSGAPSAWYGNESREDCIHRGRLGDASLVPQAEALMDELDTQIETPRRTWERAPVGHYCVVPDVLAGLPTPMRRQRETPDERAPISIFVDVGTSAVVKAELVKRRGIVALALVLALSCIRPISLFIIDAGDGPHDRSGESVLAIRINTAPLDTASACYALTSVGLTRHLIYGIEAKLNGMAGQWPSTRLWNYANPKAYYRDLVMRLGHDPERALVIPPARHGDPMLDDPLPWIRRQIAHFCATTEDEYV